MEEEEEEEKEERERRGLEDEIEELNEYDSRSFSVQLADDFGAGAGPPRVLQLMARDDDLMEAAVEALEEQMARQEQFPRPALRGAHS